MRLLSLIWIFLISCSVLPGQIRFDNYRLISKANGLPSNYVEDFAEDEQGFIWMATRAGLVRFDGQHPDILRRREKDSIFLQDDIIVSLLVSGDSLWVGTNRGVTIYNTLTDSYSQINLNPYLPEDIHLAYPLRIQDIYEDRQGDIWLAPQGCGFIKWVREKDTLIHFPLTPSPDLPSLFTETDKVSLAGIIQDITHDSIIWGVSISGIYQLDQTKGTITHILYTQSRDVLELSTNRKICCYQGPDRRLYTGAWSSGLSIYDPATGDYYRPSDPRFFPAELKRSHLYHIVPYSDSLLYLTYSKGLYLLNTKSQQLHLIKRNQHRGQKVQYGVEFIDHQGRCYSGFDHGMIVADPITEQFIFYSLAEVNETAIEVLPRKVEEGIYPGTISIVGQYTDGIYHINLENGEVRKSSAENVMTSANFFQAWGIARMDNENFLIASSSGLYQFNSRTEAITEYPKLPGGELRGYTSIIIDSYQTAWIGTHRNGLFAMNLKTNQVRSFESPLGHPHVDVTALDSLQNIWATTDHGHAVYQADGDHLKVFDYLDQASATFRNASNICVCPNGEIWMSGNEEGLGRLSSANPEVGLIDSRTFTGHDGQTIVVRWVVCGNDNSIWFMDLNNLYKVRRYDWSLSRYSFDYGAKSMNPLLQFLEDGRLFMVSRDGFYAMDPEQLKINPIKPMPYVSALRTRDNRSATLNQLGSQDTVTLTSKENYVEIDFSAICHTLPAKVTYQYRLEGLHDDWTDAGDQRSVTYAYLKGGKYRFHLRAANNEGIWNDDDYVLHLHVGTPWYNTLLFYFSLVIAGIGLMIFYNRQKTKRIKKEEKIKAEFENKMASAEMKALRAQMNPHFIFNCLNSIESNIIRNDTRKASQYLNDFSRLIRLILQNSRNPYVDLSDEIESLELYLKLEQMRLKDAFDYAIELTPGMDPDQYEIPPMLIQPFVENSIWHGLSNLEKKGRVSISIGQHEANLKCVIEDNGIGRAAAEKIKSAKSVKRASMGMKITEERMQMLNHVYHTNNTVEIIDLYDIDGRPAGTKVILIIPI